MVELSSFTQLSDPIVIAYWNGIKNGACWAIIACILIYFLFAKAPEGRA